MKENIKDPREKSILNSDESNKSTNAETTVQPESLKKGDSLDVITDSEKSLADLDENIGEAEITNVPDEGEVN